MILEEAAAIWISLFIHSDLDLNLLKFHTFVDYVKGFDKVERNEL
jgi:hypothetical protein